MQMRLIDGQVVDVESVRISGTIDIPDEDLDEFTYGSTVVVALVASIDAGSFKRQPNGDTRRVNVLAPVAMRAVGGKLREELLSVMGMSVQDSLPLTSPKPVTVSSAPPKATTTVQSVSSAVSDEEEETDIAGEAVAALGEAIEADLDLRMEDGPVVVRPAPKMDGVLSKFLQGSIQ